MIINFITTVFIAIQVLIGQVSQFYITEQDNHRIWVEIQEPCFSSVYDDDQTEYEDYWTKDLFVHLIKLSNGQELPILCSSVDEAWNRMEAYLLNKDDFDTTIIEITKDEW